MRNIQYQTLADGRTNGRTDGVTWSLLELLIATKKTYWNYLISNRKYHFISWGIITTKKFTKFNFIFFWRVFYLFRQERLPHLFNSQCYATQFQGLGLFDPTMLDKLIVEKISIIFTSWWGQMEFHFNKPASMWRNGGTNTLSYKCKTKFSLEFKKRGDAYHMDVRKQHFNENRIRSFFGT